MSETQVWVINRRDRTHRIRFPGRDNARRWLLARNPDLWEVVPVTEATEQLPSGTTGAGTR